MMAAVPDNATSRPMDCSGILCDRGSLTNAETGQLKYCKADLEFNLNSHVDVP